MNADNISSSVLQVLADFQSLASAIPPIVIWKMCFCQETYITEPSSLTMH